MHLIGNLFPNRRSVVFRTLSRMDHKLYSVVLVILVFLKIILAEDSLPSVSLSEYLADRLEPYTSRPVRSNPIEQVLEAYNLSGTVNTLGNDDSGGELISLQHVLACNKINNGIVQQIDNTLYLLSANQLFSVEVLPDQQILFQLATFETFTEPAIDFSVQPWETNKLVVVIAFRSFYHVYQFQLKKNDTSGFNAKNHAIQKIHVDSPELQCKEVHLFRQKDKLYLLRVEVNDQNSAGVLL